MKRFYKVTSAKQEKDEWTVLLDARPVNTPLKNTLITPSKDLADAIVLEWAAQEDTINPEAMPLTQFLSTKIDRVRSQRDIMSADILNYLNTDLLCYRTNEPPELAQRQAQCWDVWLNWFKDTYGASLKTTTALKAVEHEEDAHSKAKIYVDSLDDDHFTILQLVTALSGSLVLAMAFVEGKATPEDVFEATHIEEQFQAEIYDEEKYGPDPAQEKKDAALKVDLKAAALYLSLVGNF